MPDGKLACVGVSVHAPRYLPQAKRVRNQEQEER